MAKALKNSKPQIKAGANKAAAEMGAGPRPTEAELAILQVLWSEGPSTVRAVAESLNRERPSAAGYTTVLKLLQIMHEKGLVERDESERSHVYRPARPAEDTQRDLLRDLMDRAFGGSARELVLQALAAKPSSPEELAEIRRMLKNFEGGRTE